MEDTIAILYFILVRITGHLTGNNAIYYGILFGGIYESFADPTVSSQPGPPVQQARLRPGRGPADVMVSRAPVHLYRTETQVGLLKVLEMVPCTFSIIGSEITLAFQWIGETRKFT